MRVSPSSSGPADAGTDRDYDAERRGGANHVPEPRHHECAVAKFAPSPRKDTATRRVGGGSEVVTWFERRGGDVGCRPLLSGRCCWDQRLAACSSGAGSAKGTGAATTGAGSVAACCWWAPSTATPGKYRTIQAAVDAARPGDWILVAPGDYHETDDEASPPTSTDHGDFGGVLITKSDIHLRGMDRSTVIVDGTKAGSATPCSAGPAQQNFGVVGLGRQGRRTQRHRRVEGGQREHREPHGVQLPRWRR